MGRSFFVRMGVLLSALVSRLSGSNNGRRGRWCLTGEENIDAVRENLCGFVELLDEWYAGGRLAPKVLVVFAKEAHELFLLA